MGGHCMLPSHWHGGDPPATLDSDTESFKEKLGFSCICERRRIGKVIVTWAETIFMNVFYTIF